MDEEILEYYRNMLTESGMSENLVNNRVNKLSLFANMEQAKAYTELMRKRNKFLVDKKADQVPNLKDLPVSLTQALDFLQGNTPTEGQMKLGEKMVGIPPWYKEK